MGIRRKNRWNRRGGCQGTPTIQKAKRHFAWWPTKVRIVGTNEREWIWLKSYFTSFIYPKHH